ncbi:MAG: hypothetical protein K2O86_07110 [Clostridia bacterium]|nr:hypothetical protein [Clostridia bacterium]
MAFALRDRSRQDEYANYEQQSPNREVNYRQVNYQQDYMQDAYNNYQYAQGYTQAPQQEYQPQMQSQYMGSYRTQASQFVNNGFSAPQYNYMTSQEQYQSDMQFNQNYDRTAQANKITRARLGKKNINKDMIKIIVTIMVVAIAICGLLIANQFISVNQAQAEEEVQNIDSDLLTSVVTEDGSYVQTSVTLLPEYEYETSTNWFDKFCDSLGLKLK